MTESSTTGVPGDPRRHRTDEDATRIGLPLTDDDATRVGLPPTEDDATRVGLPPTEDDATRVGLPPTEDDATRVGRPLTDDDATRVGHLPLDDDATRVGFPPADPAVHQRTEPFEDPDQTFVSIREPVLPWNDSGYAPQTTSAQRPPRTAASGGSTGRDRPQVMTALRKHWWWIVALVVLVVAAVILASTLVRHQNRADVGAAEQTVEDYLDAVVDGDAATALKLWRPDTSSGEDLILDPEVYAAAKNRPTRYDITSTAEDGDDVTVKAELTQSGQSFPLSFSLRQSDRDEGTWTITQGPEAFMVLRSPATDVQVNAQPVTLPKDQEKVRLAALPGDYRVLAASSRDGVNYVDSTVTVLPTSGEDGRSSLSFPSPQTRVAIDAGAAPGAGGPRPGNAKELTNVHQGFATLMSPASNIGCEFSEASKGCGLLSYRDDPHGAENSGHWWFDLEGGDGSSLQTHDGQARFQAEDANPYHMDYGESVYYKENVCTMEMTGMTCWDTRTGHGVFMSRRAYNTF
jgi:hypothetical protein